MFRSKKYIFETNKTKISRKISNFIFFLISSFFAYSLICFILLLVSKRENQSTQESLFKRSPDLIVVFTGDKGRIQYAIKLAKKYKQSNILISGVHSKNNVNTLLKNIDATNINTNFLDLDYNAKNTFQNVKRTIQFIQDKKKLKNILIISHDYHILRIKAIFEDQQKKYYLNYNFLYTGIKSNFNSFRNIKILYKEVFKFFRTLGFLILEGVD